MLCAREGECVFELKPSNFYFLACVVQSFQASLCEVYNFGKEKVFRLDLNESREGFCRRGRGRSFHVDGPSFGVGIHVLESVYCCLFESVLSFNIVTWYRNLSV